MTADLSWVGSLNSASAYLQITRSQSLNQHWLQQYVDESLKTGDDRVIFINAVGQNLDLFQMAVTMLQTWGTSWSIAYPQSLLRSAECSGPHLLDHGKLYKVYRLYDDVNGAFMMATKPNLNSEYGLTSEAMRKENWRKITDKIQVRFRIYRSVVITVHRYVLLSLPGDPQAAH